MSDYISLKCAVNDNFLSRKCNAQIPSKTQNFVYIEFEFSVIWDGVGTVTALFQNSTTSISTAVTENKVKVPWEMMQNTGSFRLSLFADDLLLTNQIEFYVYDSGYTDESVDPASPTPNVYHEILERAESGGFNGKTAYQSAVDGGYVGSEVNFNNDLSLVSSKADHSEVIAEENARVAADNHLQELAQSAIDIAQEKTHAREFDTYEQMVLWLAVPENVATLNVGDVLWIVDTGVPDYWWGTTGLHILETQKIDLIDYLQKTGDTRDTVTSFAEAANLENIVSGETESVFKGKLKKWFTSVISKFGDIANITFGVYDTMVNALNGLNGLKSDKTAITPIAGDGLYTYVTLDNNTEYRIDSYMVQLNITMPTIIDASSEFVSCVVFSSSGNLTANPIGFSSTYAGFSNSILYSGDDCTGGTFTIAASKRYNIMYFWDGARMNGIVRGV